MPEPGARTLRRKFLTDCANGLGVAETELKGQVVAVLRKAHWRVYVCSERRKGYTKFPTGWPDIFARHVEKRVCVWIECKAPGEKLRPDQTEFMLEALAAGERYWTIDSLGELTFNLARV